MIVDRFQSWFKSNELGLEERFSSVEFQINTDPDNRVANLVLIDDKALTQIIVWDRGFCDLEMISSESFESLRYEHREISGSNELDSTLRAYLKIMDEVGSEEQKDGRSQDKV